MEYAGATKVDVLVIAAHPDDAELGLGGTLHKLAQDKRTTAIVDCTRGELGSRGTPAIREREAAEAARILGVHHRLNLGIEDGNIEISKENIRKVISAIRAFQPDILVFPAERDRHPDHENVHRLVRNAVFQSGLPKVETQLEGVTQEVYRPKRSLCFMQTYEFIPTFYIDITASYEAKISAIQAYASQFYIESNSEFAQEPETFISRPAFRNFLDARAQYFGAKIGVQYAEAFYTLEPMGLDSLSLLL